MDGYSEGITGIGPNLMTPGDLLVEKALVVGPGTLTVDSTLNVVDMCSNGNGLVNICSVNNNNVVNIGSSIGTITLGAAAIIPGTLSEKPSEAGDVALVRGAEDLTVGTRSLNSWIQTGNDGYAAWSAIQIGDIVQLTFQRVISGTVAATSDISIPSGIPPIGSPFKSAVVAHNADNTLLTSGVTKTPDINTQFRVTITNPTGTGLTVTGTVCWSV